MKIHTYAADGNYSGVRSELEKGVPVDVKDEQDYTPLAYAASSSKADEKSLRLLIDAGADVNAAVDDSMKTPLNLAACSGSLSKAQLLLEAGADIRFKSPNGYTVLINLMYALNDDEMLVPMAEFLVRNGAEMDCETDYGESPLSVASHLGRFDAVKYLLDAGAEPTPLRWTEVLKTVALETCDDVQRLLERGGSLNDRDRWERTAWLLATFTNDVEKAKLLYSAGANINDRERGGNTALINCAASGHTEMLKWLIDIGADIEAADDAGYTAIMLAAQEGETDCVQLLLEAGADPSRKNEYDENAMSMAATESVVRLLAEAGEEISEISTEMKRMLTGLHGGESLNVSKAEYEAGRRPRFGRSNPQLMDISFWREMVRAGYSVQVSAEELGEMFDKFLQFILGGSDESIVFVWPTDWSNYFDAGKEWRGSFLWSLSNPGSDRIVVIAASSTD